MLECRLGQTRLGHVLGRFVKNISVIILNWNAANDTIRCVQNMLVWKRIKPTIWVVDNASGAEQTDLIAHQCPPIQLIRNAINLGYAGGNNQAIAAALENGNNPILLLNNDAQIDEENLLRLLTSLDIHPKVGIVGPLLFDAEDKARLLTAGGQNVVRHLTSHISQVRGEVPLQFVDYIPGTVLLSRADVFRTVGLLDAAYFFSGELPDWCYRARQKGYLSAVDTQARAYHTVSRSSRFRKTLYPYYIIRNRFLFIRKFYAYSSKIWLFGFWTAYSLALSIKVQLAGKGYMAQAIRMGLWDGWRGRFGGQNERVLAACLKKLEDLPSSTPTEPQP